jgi:hypothetical protein
MVEGVSGTSCHCAKILCELCSAPPMSLLPWQGLIQYLRHLPDENGFDMRSD